METETTIRDQNLVVFDVYHSDATSAGQKHAQDSKLALLQDRRAKLNSKLDTLVKQSEVLERFGKGLTGSETKPEDLAEFLDMQFRFEEKLFLDLQSVKKELVSVEKEIREVTSASQLAHEEKKAISVTSIILTEAEGLADVLLTYSSYFVPDMVQPYNLRFLIVVCDASWKVLYDIRADVKATLGQSGSSEASNTKITIDYRASIIQTTGEDWKGVSLTLSTASPNLGSKIPELTPWNIHTWGVGAVSVARASRSRRGPSGMSSSLQSHLSQSADVVRFKQTARKVTVTEGAISSSYEIAGLSTIPSDGSEHKVTIAVRALTARRSWY